MTPYGFDPHWVLQLCHLYQTGHLREQNNFRDRGEMVFVVLPSIVAFCQIYLCVCLTVRMSVTYITVSRVGGCCIIVIRFQTNLTLVNIDVCIHSITGKGYSIFASYIRCDIAIFLNYFFDCHAFKLEFFFLSFLLK